MTVSITFAVMSVHLPLSLSLLVCFCCYSGISDGHRSILSQAMVSLVAVLQQRDGSCVFLIP